MAGVSIAEAAAAIESGALAIVPTDTVYGIAARTECAAAVFDLKQRPRDKALPVLAAGVDQLDGVADLDGNAKALAGEHWPGPLTLVVRRSPGFTADLGGTDPGTVAARVPAHPVALELLERTGPLAVTSANVSGEPPAHTFEEACALAGGSGVLCLDGGVCDGLPSTILSVVGEPEILREGALDGARLLDWLRSRAS